MYALFYIAYDRQILTRAVVRFFLTLLIYIIIKDFSQFKLMSHGQLG